MPSVDIAERPIVYFGAAAPSDIAPGSVPDIWDRSWEIALNEAPQRDLCSVLSQMIGKTLHPKDPAKLTPDEKALQQMLRAYEAFFEDTACLEDMDIRRNEEDKIEAAQFNQRLAQDFTLLGIRRDPQAMEAAEFLVEATNALAETQMQFGRECQRVLDGARAQAALYLTLGRQGCVLAPDPDDPGEVETWDVHGGADLVFLHKEADGKCVIHLIDAKSQFGQGSGGFFIKNDSPRVEASNLSADEENPQVLAANQSIVGQLTALAARGKLDYGEVRITKEDIKSARLRKQTVYMPTDLEIIHLDGTMLPGCEQELIAKILQ